MDLTLDKFGRLVIPKAVREALGLGPGSTLEVDTKDEALVLRPRRPEPDLVEEEGVLVFTGEAAGDLSGAVARHRGERLTRLASWTAD